MRPSFLFCLSFLQIVSVVWASASLVDSWSLSSRLRRFYQADRSLRRLEVVPRSIPSGWTSLGCAQDGSSRAFSYSYSSSAMTQESCIATCDSLSYTYAAVEYSSQCYCGSTLMNGLGTSLSSSSCNMACNGNSAEMCGGFYTMNLFSKSSASTTTTTWTLSNACLVDTGSRILQSYSYSTSSLTPASCQQTCQARGYTLAGVENGDECYCGNSFAGGTPTTASTSDCSAPCTGASSSTCGGSYDYNNNFYHHDEHDDDEYDDNRCIYRNLGPYPSLRGRHLGATSAGLQHEHFLQLSFHLPNNMLWQRILYRRCRIWNYCGNSYSSTPVSASTGDCNMACAGDSTQLCGGSWRAQIYTYGTASTTTTTTTSTTATSTPTWALSNPCVVDTSSRILQGYSTGGSSNTPSSCESICAGQGFTIAAVEYGQECYCGNSFSSTPVNASISDCNMACSGNSALLCGSSWRAQIYTVVSSSTTTTTTTTTTTSTTTTTTTTTTTSTSTPSPTFVAAPLASGWSLSRACAADNGTSSVLQGYSTTSTSLTPASCQTTCANKGLTIAGVKNGSGCFCGNAFVGGAPAILNATVSCQTPCSGNASYACGGVGTMAIYTSTTTSMQEFWQTTWDRSTLLTSMTGIAPVPFTTYGTPAETDMTVDETQVYQQMDGFGAALSDASAKLFYNLKNQNSTAYNTLLHDFFDITNGVWSAANNVLRVPLGSSDFSETLWSYDNTAGDTSFANFNINNAPSYVWPVLADILAINPKVKIYIVPWSPPAWMKTTNSMNGGSMNPSYIPIYHNYLFKAVQGFKSKGITVYAVAIQNEPMYSDSTYPSCTIAVADEATIGTNLRTILNNNGYSSVKILGFDHNFDQVAGYPTTLMQTAPNAFAGASFHCYGGSSSNLATFQAAFPSKEIHITECSGVYGTDWWNDIKVRSFVMAFGDTVNVEQGFTSNLFIGGPQYGSRSAMMWNLALNSTGQPKLPGSDSCGGPPCRGVVQINSDGTYSFNAEFWPIAHAGKAIAPRDAGGPFGQRIGVSLAGTYYWSLKVSAYVTPRLSPTDLTRYTLVVLNWRDYASTAWNPTPQITTINWRGVQATYTFPVGLTTLSWYA
ncbi:Glycoside hydrolase [Mycena chlorophos]|uniref:Glycoside hydrolase n=1 Tax=Mycena chlorophos TaxID=658473 RepID=A0A8H6WS22_MYCCL|nr:Glycoside hydrolase [Mycena chlorophos]